MKKDLPVGIKAVIAYLIFFSLGAFIFPFVWEPMKATYFLRQMPESEQRETIEWAKQRHGNIPSDDLNAIGKIMAAPRVKGHLVPAVINVLILLPLIWGLFNLKEWARDGIILYGATIIFGNLWFLKSWGLPQGIYLPEFIHCCFIILALTISLLYLLRSNVKKFFKVA